MTLACGRQPSPDRAPGPSPLECHLDFLRRLFQRPDPRAAPLVRLPEGHKIYAIGDIHGRADLLVRMAALIEADLKASPAAKPLVILLGDYVDRGLDSRAVLEHLSKGLFSADVVHLCGNHELMLLGFLSDPETAILWRQNGGVETLHSYGIDVRDFRAGRDFREVAAQFQAALPAHHLAFLKKTKLSFTSGDYFFCHAGVRPGIALEQQKEEDLLWIRQEFLQSEANFGKVVVHGHTPVMEPEIHPNRINVDTGAYISGRLTALVLEGSDRKFISTTLPTPTLTTPKLTTRM